MGGNAYTEAVQKELDLPFEAAEQVKKGIPVDGATFEEVRPVLRAVTENVLLEIQKTFDFFKATVSSEQIDRIVLSGGASRVDGFREMLQDRFGAPVEDFNPFRTVTWDAKKLGGDPPTSRPRRPSRSASRCGGWATDDSHQPARRRAAEGAPARRSPSTSARASRWSAA